MSTSAFQLRSRFRALTDHTVTVLAILATILVIAPLAVIFAELIYKGVSSLNLDFFTKVPAPEGETGGGMANAIVGSGCPAGTGQPYRHSHRHWQRRLSGRVWPRHKTGQCRALHCRRSQWRSLHRHGRDRLRAHRGSSHQLACPFSATSPRSPAAWRWAS